MSMHFQCIVQPNTTLLDYILYFYNPGIYQALHISAYLEMCIWDLPSN